MVRRPVGGDHLVKNACRFADCAGDGRPRDANRTRFVPPWILTVNGIESALGRLSARVDITVSFGNVVWHPFVSASVFHEFEGGVTSSSTSNFSAISTPLPTLSSTVTTSSLGAYGQFGLGIAMQTIDIGWVGYLRADYRTGKTSKAEA